MSICCNGASELTERQGFTATLPDRSPKPRFVRPPGVPRRPAIAARIRLLAGRNHDLHHGGAGSAMLASTQARAGAPASGSQADHTLFIASRSRMSFSQICACSRRVLSVPWVSRAASILANTSSVWPTTSLERSLAVMPARKTKPWYSTACASTGLASVRMILLMAATPDRRGGGRLYRQWARRRQPLAGVDPYPSSVRASRAPLASRSAPAAAGRCRGRSGCRPWWRPGSARNPHRSRIAG